MKEHAFLFFALVLPACSGSSSDDVPAPGDSALSDSSNADTHSGTEGGTDSSVTPDTSVETSGDDVATADSGDAGDDPKPPAGSTKCAFGTVTQADAFKACGEPSMTLDYKSDFDGGFTKVPRHCEAATIDSGRYEVWCSPTSTYIWARFEGLRSTSAWSGGCPGEEPLALGMALWDYGIGSSGGGGSLTGVKGIPTFSFTKSSPINVVAEVTITGPAPSGAAHFFLTGYHFATCSGGKPGWRDDDAVVTAMSFAWPKK